MPRRSHVVTVFLACAAMLLPSVANAAPTSFVTPPLPSKYATPFQAGNNGAFEGAAVSEAGGTVHAVWIALGEKSIVSCAIPLGARACSPAVTLTPTLPGNDIDGRVLVLLPAPNTVEVLAYECCSNGQSLYVTTWTSTDDGKTFGGPVQIGSLDGLDNAVLDGSQLVLFAEIHDGLHEQVTTPGSTPATTDTIISPDHYDSKVALLPGGALLIGHDDFASGNPYTTTIQIQSTPGSAVSTVATFPAEAIDSLVTGPNGTYLMTREDTPVLDPPVLIRQWNGTGFNAPHTLPVPGAGDDARFNLGIDGLGHLHVVWVGARENYRLWHSVSTNGGKTWSAQLLGDAINADEEYPVLDAIGAGLAIEPGGGSAQPPVIVQPLLITPTLSLTIKPSKVKLGTATKLSGGVTPAVKNRVVDIQQENGKHWVTVAKPKEDKFGHFSLTVTRHSVGTVTYRAYVDGQYGTYDIGISAAKSLKVIPAT